MSLFRSLQSQPRIISIFTNNIAGNSSAKLIYDKLRQNEETKAVVHMELHEKFPTLDQLKYMNDMNPKLLKDEIPNINELLKKPSHDKLFGSNLSQCTEMGNWKSNTTIWVDWEKQKIGIDVKSLEDDLGKN
ncbi:hypothetical protein Kpol_448p9 [Vanderwaltozyma polyspora DSM 70294]|uniref:Redox protein FMP46, mitochondrial n=1 Tax=Vanderwaltozyma polyspora (strain ATCC 22028 / DSM 70294 / BCRC 21397 / CBS 2163 / NBRC 10782 / NRRL Y-8283 / UCD 57-17) TaxID=436907 RepID=A7TQY4_VANPO|nr:uncharacterized protein Kpol_448p9 [Vanderwaltozyma polyspora DSM 70294]EDO15321.1 hypothetical protein Kpol_448p9 [Vanderwaltozyma polyspora DSM 70294]